MSPSATTTRTEIVLVYFAGIVQGLALVTFPAASAIFTSPDGFGFDSTRYGTLFVPQVVLAILASALAPKLARRWDLRTVLLVGIAGDIVSMSLLALSRLLLSAPDMAFGILLIATGATRCSDWEPPRRRCWWQSSAAWAYGGCSPSWWRASWC